MLNSLYNQRGVAKYQPGNLTHSDNYFENCYYPYVAPVYAQTTMLAATFPAASTVLFSITLLATLEVFSGSIIVGATVDSTSITNQINQILPAKYTVSVNTAGNYQFDTGEAGTQGAFNLTFNGTTTTNTLAPSALLNLQVARFVVPVTTNNNTGLGLPDSQVAYRNVALGDSADLLSAGVFVTKDAHSNALRIYDYNEQGRVYPGTTFAGLSRGQIILNPITFIGATDALLVETNVVGDLVGRLTRTPTATTLAIPAGKMRVVSGSTVVGQLIEVKITF